MKLIPVESSMIHAVGYDAESKGRYMRANIIDVYPYYQVSHRQR